VLPERSDPQFNTTVALGVFCGKARWLADRVRFQVWILRRLRSTVEPIQVRFWMPQVVQNMYRELCDC